MTPFDVVIIHLYMYNCITCIYRLRLGDSDDSPTIIIVSAIIMITIVKILYGESKHVGLRMRTLITTPTLPHV